MGIVWEMLGVFKVNCFLTSFIENFAYAWVSEIFNKAGF
jgi:hypothetical protein